MFLHIDFQYITIFHRWQMLIVSQHKTITLTNIGSKIFVHECNNAHSFSKTASNDCMYCLVTLKSKKIL